MLYLTIFEDQVYDSRRMTHLHPLDRMFNKLCLVEAETEIESARRCLFEKITDFDVSSYWVEEMLKDVIPDPVMGEGIFSCSERQILIYVRPFNSVQRGPPRAPDQFEAIFKIA